MILRLNHIIISYLIDKFYNTFKSFQKEGLAGIGFAYEARKCNAK